MSLRKSDIAQRLVFWLRGYTPPQGIKDSPELVQAEADKLLAVLLKFAPQVEYQPWLNAMFDQLEYQMKTRAWPSKAEVGAVCANMRKEDVQRGAIPRTSPPTPAEINAARIKAGEPVGDAWLFGRLALELVAEGHVSEGELNTYRNSMFRHIRKTYVGDEAERLIRTYEARHSEAKTYGEPSPRNVRIPDKRVTPPEGWAAE